LGQAQPEAYRVNLPIGHILVHQGVMTEKQVASILEEQERTGRPFGALAEEMFGVSAKSVEKAWAEQYAEMAEWVDPTIAPIDPAVAGLITRRQAWQFSILPLGMQGETLRVCTTVENLTRALNFATKHFPTSVYFLIAEPEDLTRALQRHYPMDGMTQETMGNPEAFRQVSKA
jgi:hypothetical protein